MAKRSKAQRKARRMQRRQEKGGSFFGRLLRSAAPNIPIVGGLVSGELEAKAQKKYGNLGASADMALAEMSGPPQTGANIVLDRLAGMDGYNFAATNQPDRSASSDPGNNQLMLRKVSDDSDGDSPADGSKEPKKGVPMWVWIVGGAVVLLGILALVFGRRGKPNGNGAARRRSGSSSSKRSSSSKGSSSSKRSSSSKGSSSSKRSSSSNGNPFPGVNPTTLRGKDKETYWAWMRSRQKAGRKKARA